MQPQGSGCVRLDSANLATGTNLGFLSQVHSGITIEGTECDVSSPASVSRLVSFAQAKLGRIDVWINNAGYSGSFQVSNPSF